MASATLDLLISLKDEASGALEKVSGAMGGLATIAGGAALAGVVGLGAALVGGANDAREAAKITAQTQAVITSTGAAAGVTAQQVADYAASLSAASGASLFGDDQIQQSSNLLLTFTNIKDGALQAATAMSVDMAQALGGAPKDAAMQLGKALNDPIAGVGALSRVGVTFTEEQKATIQTMQEAGDVAGAQAVILAELSKEFGGSAAAAAAADGGIAQFKDRLGEAAETAGGAFLPLLNNLGAMLNDVVAPAVEAAAVGFAAFLAANQPAIEAFAASFVAFVSTAIPPFLAGIAQMQPIFEAFVNAAIPAFLAGIAQMQTTLQPLVDFISANLQPILVGLGAALLVVVVPAFVAWAVAAGAAALATVVALAPVLVPLAAIGAAVALLTAAWQTDFGGIRTLIEGWWTGTLQPIFTELQTWLSATLTGALTTLAGFWTGTLQPALQAVWGFIQDSVIPLLGSLVTGTFAAVQTGLATLAGFWTDTLQPALNDVWSFIDTNIIPIFEAVANVADAVLGLALQSLADLWTGTLQPALNDVWSFIDANVIPVFESLAGETFDAVQSAVETVASYWTGTLQPAFEDAASVVSSTLSPALDGIASVFDTISNAISGAVGWLNDLASAIRSLPSIPGLPGGGGGGGSVPGFASGTSYAPGGLAVVGERGPELINLPRGSQVYTASQSRGMMGGTQQTISIVINAAPGMNEQRIAAAVGRELGRQADSRRRVR